MKKMIPLLLILLVGCEKEVTRTAEIDGKQIPRAPDYWYYADWNNHRYVVTRNMYGSGGIHDPDCPYCQKKK